MPQTITQQSAHQFASDLSLITPEEIRSRYALMAAPTKTGFTPKEGSKQAIVDSGIEVAFQANVTGQTRSDLTAAMLFAQLGADHDHNRFKDTEAWYERYVDILDHIGFIVQNFKFNKFEAGDVSLQIDNVVLEVIAAIATEDEVLLAKASLDALNKLSNDDDRFVIFAQHTFHDGRGCFQLGMADEVNGAMSMKLGAFYFDSKVTDTKILWITIPTKSIDIFKSNQTVTYDPVLFPRDTIVNRVKPYLADYAADVPF